MEKQKNENGKGMDNDRERRNSTDPYLRTHKPNATPSSIYQHEKILHGLSEQVQSRRNVRIHQLWLSYDDAGGE